jgi:hypothetical protein
MDEKGIAERGTHIPLINRFEQGKMQAAPPTTLVSAGTLPRLYFLGRC